MIRAVVPAQRSFAFDSYLQGEGASLAGCLAVTSYEELRTADRLPLGTYVFTALDFLGPAERELAELVIDALESAGQPLRILNRPRAVLLRDQLLAAAHAAGLNDFRASPAAIHSGPHADSARSPLRYPVFVRQTHEHNGSLTPLLQDAESLERALAALRLRGFAPRDLLVVEFCDTADDTGLYRKYSAYRVGDRILPRYMNASRHWMVKQETRIWDMALAEEELAFLLRNPHEQWLSDVFSLAGVEYGRIDYGIKDGRPRLWEINTNPTIGRRAGAPRVRPPEVERYRAHLAPGKAHFYREFEEAWRAVDTPVAGEVELRVPRELVCRIEHDVEAGRRARSRVAAAHRFAHARWGRILKRGLEPVALRIAPYFLRFWKPAR